MNSVISPNGVDDGFKPLGLAAQRSPIHSGNTLSRIEGCEQSEPQLQKHGPDGEREQDEDDGQRFDRQLLLD